MDVAAVSDLAAFHEFVATQLERNAPPITPEEAVEAFRAYQRDLARFKHESQSAIDEVAQSRTKPLDALALKDRVRQRLARMVPAAN
jgi:hypothetical protein